MAERSSKTVDIELKVVIGVFIAITAGTVWFCIHSSNQSDRDWQNFNNECLREHKQYECTAMWRKGETDTVVIPMPVVISH